MADCTDVRISLAGEYVERMSEDEQQVVRSIGFDNLEEYKKIFDKYYQPGEDCTEDEEEDGRCILTPEFVKGLLQSICDFYEGKYITLEDVEETFKLA